MATSNVDPTKYSARQTRFFLLEIFETEGMTDRPPRNIDARIAASKIKLDVPSNSLQSGITEVLTNFILRSEEQSEQVYPYKCYEFIDASNIRGCREEDAVEFLLHVFFNCNQELKKTTLFDRYKANINVTKNAMFSVFIMILRGYLDDPLSSRRAILVFVKRLLQDTIPFPFLQGLLEYAMNPTHSDEDALTEIFNPIFEILRSGMASQHLELNKDQEVQDILRVMKTLLNMQLEEDGRRPLCDLLVNRVDFLPTISVHCKGKEIALMSYLGPFFNYGLVSSQQFLNNRVFVNKEAYARRTDGLVLIEQKKYFDRMSRIRDSLFYMMQPIAEEPPHRTKMLNWMTAIITANHQRTRSQCDPATVCENHYMVNLLFVMYRLTKETVIGRINMEYPFLPGTLIDISNETRLRMDETMATEFAVQYAERPTEHDPSTVIVFLTIAAQKLVFPPLYRQIHDYKLHEINLWHRVYQARNKVNRATTPSQREQLEKKLKFEEDHWKATCRHLLCLKTLTRDPVLQYYAFDFAENQLELVMKALWPDLKLDGDDSQFPAEPTQLFSAYPEHFLEDVLDFYIYCLQTASTAILEVSKEWVSLCTVLFTHYETIKSPFLVAKLATLLASLPTPFWPNVLNVRMAEQRLLISMIKLYSNCEESGDLHDKYKVRGNVQRMLMIACENMNYRTEFINMAKECGQDFIQFINMVIENSSWCIDESLSALRVMHRIERKMANPAEWDADNLETRNRNIDDLNESRKKARGCIGIAKRNLELILFIIGNSTAPFLTPAIGERLASMLNHILSQILRSNHRELVVNNPAYYGWQPREFINKLIQIHLGLNEPAFIKYIAYDERTYTPVFFTDIVSRMKQHNILGSREMELFENLAKEVEKQYNLKALLETEYANVPEEFKDPIMDAIMEDPVQLPSGHIMDRVVIERHLLSTPNNPFNRAALTKEELVPVVDLKARIEEWKIQKRNS